MSFEERARQIEALRSAAKAIEFPAGPVPPEPFTGKTEARTKLAREWVDRLKPLGLLVKASGLDKHFDKIQWNVSLPLARDVFRFMFSSEPGAWKHLCDRVERILECDPKAFQQEREGMRQLFEELLQFLGTDQEPARPSTPGKQSTSRASGSAESGTDEAEPPEVTDDKRPLGAPPNDQTEAAPSVRSSPAPKRSTARGEARVKLISALTEHHKYAFGGCLNLEAIGINKLAREATVALSTAWAFFNKEFGGHLKYRSVCRDAGRLADSLKALNGEFSPIDIHLYGRRPAGEDDRDDEK
jgi:hypothetical protein